MYETNMRKFVCTVLNNERGLTFMNMIVTIMIISITLPLLVSIFNIIHIESDEDDIAVMQFFVYLRDDMLYAESMTVADNKLYFILPTKEIATIEQYNDIIRRRVNGLGHEVYLRNIKDFKLERLDFGTKVNVITEEGKTFEKIIAHYE